MRKRRPLPPATVEALYVSVVLALVVGAGVGGWFMGHGMASTTTAAATPAATAPAGHIGGDNLPVASIGDPAAGRDLFVSKGCADCHSYEGAGGTDAPPLNSMQGHLSATEIANMSGRIWDHLPQMLPHFEDEGIPVPTFQDNEMADLIAYLHSGQGGPPDVTASMSGDEG